MSGLHDGNAKMTFNKTIYLLMILTLLLGSCGGGSGRIRFPEPRPLGSGYDVWQASSDAADTTHSRISMEHTGELTLRKALARALMDNPGLKVHSYNVRAAEAARLGVGLAPDPELEFEIEEFGGPGRLSEFQSAEYSVQLSQVIEIGGKRGKRRRLAQLEMESAGWGYEAARLNVFSEVTRAFHEVLAAQRKLDILKELLDSSQKTLESVARRVEAGKDAPLELTKARIAHSRVTVELKRAEGRLDVSRVRLAETWGASDPAFDEAAGDLEEITPVPEFDDLLGLIEQNPEIIQSMIDRDSRNAALSLEKAIAIPDLTLRGGMKRFSESGENSLILGVSFPIPIFERNRGGRLVALQEAAAADENLKVVDLRVRSRLVEAYNDLSVAYAEVHQLKDDILGSAEKVYEASRRSYEEGKADYLMVLDAQRTLFELKTHYNDILVTYHSAKVEVEKLTGTSIEEVLSGKREVTR